MQKMARRHHDAPIIDQRPVRPHPRQIECAAYVRKLLAGSQFTNTISLDQYAAQHLGQTIGMADHAERAIFLAAGAARIRDRILAAGDMAVCTPGVEVEIAALEDCRLILFGGAPIGDRILWWNLVSSSPARIEKAKQDWLNGGFGKVPGETEFIPLPE